MQAKNKNKQEKFTYIYYPIT